MPRVTHNSGNFEWYTPPEYVEAARVTMGGIDLDPASSERANETVQAKRIYTAADNGLKHPWAGKLWMNPPYAVELIGRFIAKLRQEVEAGQVTEAIVLTHNATDTAWFADLTAVAAAMCLPRGRVRCWHPSQPEKGSPLQGHSVVYIGQHPDRFLGEFSKFGAVWVPSETPTEGQCP